MIWKEAVGFTCDEVKCSTRFTAMYPNDIVDAYLDLIEAGWHVKTPSGRRREHYCPEHTPGKAAP